MASNKEINGNNVVRMDAAKYNGKYYRHLEVDGRRLYCQLNPILRDDKNIIDGKIFISSTLEESRIELYLSETIRNEIQKPRGGIIDGKEYVPSPDWENMESHYDYYFFAISSTESNNPSYGENAYYGTYSSSVVENDEDERFSYIDNNMEYISFPLSKIHWKSFGNFSLTPLMFQGGCGFYSGENHVVKTQDIFTPVETKNESYTIENNLGGGGNWFFDDNLASGTIEIDGNTYSFENSIVSVYSQTNYNWLYISINNQVVYSTQSPVGLTITYNLQYAPKVEGENYIKLEIN